MSAFRLKVFRSVAHHLNFTKAAEELYVPQPAITRHIKELESEYGLRLFERTNGHLLLTEAGKCLLVHVERILEAHEILDYEMRKMSGSAGGALRIGASTTIAQYVIPAALAAFSQLHHGMELSLRSENTEEVEMALLAQEIDVGLVEGSSRHRVLHYTPFLKDELVAIVRAQSSLAARDELQLSDLIRMPLVLREQGSGTLDVFIDALRKKGVRTVDLNAKIHLGCTESIKRFLIHTDMVGIVSIRAVRDELSKGIFKILDIPELPLYRELSVVQRQGQEEGLAADFVRFIFKHQSDLL